MGEVFLTGQANCVYSLLNKIKEDIVASADNDIQETLNSYDTTLDELNQQAEILSDKMTAFDNFVNENQNIVSDLTEIKNEIISKTNEIIEIAESASSGLSWFSFSASDWVQDNSDSLFKLTIRKLSIVTDIYKTIDNIKIRIFNYDINVDENENIIILSPKAFDGYILGSNKVMIEGEDENENIFADDEEEEIVVKGWDEI